jgi:hypothetical protein
VPFENFTFMFSTADMATLGTAINGTKHSPSSVCHQPLRTVRPIYRTGVPLPPDVAFYIVFQQI